MASAQKKTKPYNPQYTQLTSLRHLRAPAPTSAKSHPAKPPPGYNVNAPTVDFLALLSVLTSIVDYIALALLIIDRENQQVPAVFFCFALVFAFLFRLFAVYQYFEQITFLSRLSNVFLGSRFGWREKYDLDVMRQAKIGTQFGFPLVLHSVADLVQQGFTYYPLFILVTSGDRSGIDDNGRPRFYVFYVFALILTVASMLAALIVRLTYGASLISLSLQVVYATVLLAFGFANLTFDIEFEDKFYTKGMIFPWVKFLTLTIAAFTTAAVEVRQKKRIIFPNIMTSLVTLYFIFDILCIMLVQLKPSVFVDTDNGVNITQDGVVVDQIIYANTFYTFYVGLYMFVQWRLVLFGHIH